WLQAFFDLLGKTLRIGGGAECFLRQNRRCLMMSVTVVVRARKARNQHIRAKLANDADDVLQWNIVPAPLLKRLFRRFRVSEVRNPTEALLDSVVIVRGEQLKRAQNPELVGERAPGLILPALASRQGHQQGL